MSRKVKIGEVTIGGGEKIAVQSMTTKPTKNADECIAQINELHERGCDIVRVAVPDEESARAIEKIKENTKLPIVADIHFDYKLALICIENGIDKIRINPGNIGSEERAGMVAKAAREKKIPIRIGVNGGSLEKELLAKYGGATPEAMLESAKRHIEILNKYDFDDIVISLKASSVKKTIEAYRLASRELDYPLHLGVTEAGTSELGIVKSSIGIGSLLADGIGDTIRVSLTDNPIYEVDAGRNILKALGYYEGIEVVSCPTCARCRINLIDIAKKVNEAVKNINKPLKVAVMGCVVNGPGEAKDADIGIAGGDGCAVMFKHGEIMGKIPENEVIDRLLAEIEKM